MHRTIDEDRLEDIILDVLFGQGIFDKCYNQIKELTKWLEHTPQSIIDDGFSVEDAEAIEKDKIENEFLTALQEKILNDVREYEIDPDTGKERVCGLGDIARKE